MADDPNRDILPVREGSCPDTCRSSIDPRERYLVYKLDRYELEDKYLRLFEEAKNLKKLSNCQEDKIKRLATKLMRVAANPRACNVSLNVYDDKNRIIALELENSKLKDKITALRNQVLSHKISGRSSSRSHNTQARPSSGRITCRSESSRTKIPSCHCITETGDNDNEAQNNLDTVETLSAEKKEMANRISELEKEMSDYAANNQRVKTAENIEYIKVWRQMKQLNDKLIATEDTNKLLNAQIDDLKWKLEEATKRNNELTAALMGERKRLSDMDEQLLKARDSQFSLREKEEQINGLMNEMKILQQHNNELVELSSKRGEVEQENMELKRKVSEQLQDQETLKTAFNSEQANIVALKASNEQLLGKLQELQKNIDTLTVQFTSFQTQTEKQETTKTTQISTKQNDMQNPQIIDKPDSYKNTASQVERCKKCCEAFEKILQLEENMCVTRKTANLVDKCMQTEFVSPKNNKEQEETTTPLKGDSKKEEPVKQTAKEPEKESPKEPVKENVEHMPTENPLTPEKMLKLLEQAQINTSPDSVRYAQKDMIGNVDYNLLDLNQRHSNTENPVQANSASQPPRSTYQQQESNNNANITQPLVSQFSDPNKILSILCNILQGYSQTHLLGDATIVCPPISPPDYQCIKDINNNVATTCLGEKYMSTAFKYNVETKNVTGNMLQVGCSARRYCSSPYERPHSEKLRKRTVWGLRKRDRINKFNETSQDCTCSNTMKCNINSICEQRCCSDNPSRSITGDIPNGKKSSNNPASVKNNPTEIPSTKTLNSAFIPRKLQDDDGTNPYNVQEQHANPVKIRDTLDNERSLQEYIEQLEKCKELVNQSRTLSNAAGIPMKEMVNRENVRELIRCRDVTDEFQPETRRAESYCNMHCPNECSETLSTLSDSFPLVIPEGQGLLELHIVSLQLSTSAKQILYEEANIDNVSLFVSWDIWNQETTYTPTQKCPKLNFNSSFVYRISNLFSFFNYVLLEFVVFHVNVSHENNNDYTVSKGRLCIKDILDYPQNKLHYIAPVNSILPCSLGMNFGQLSLWVRLSCDVEKVDRFKNTRGILTDHRSTAEMRPVALTQPVIETPVRSGLHSRDDIEALKDKRSKSRLLYEPSKEMPSSFKQLEFMNESSDTTDVADDNAKTFSKIPLTVVKESDEDARSHSSYENTRHALQVQRSIKMVNGGEPSDLVQLPLKRDLQKRSSVEEFTTVMSKTQEAAQEIPDAITPGNSNETMSEITNVLSEKNWEEYKQRSLLTFAESNTGPDKESSDDRLTDYSQTDTDTISIDILNMILFPTSSVMKNDEIQLLYIEYSFLGYAGADMETLSAVKPRLPETKLFFNFRRKFKVDEETHSVQNSILRAMLDGSTNPNIRFILVSEPLPEETEIKECVEVGYANFNLKEYAFGDTEKVVSVQLHSLDGTEQIGLLKILVSGINTIRQRLGRRESNL